MQQPYLEVTFRGGKPFAAYYYLPRRPGDRSIRTEQAEAGLVIDFARGGRPIGIEITAPNRITMAALNRVLRSLGQDPITRAEFAPLRAA
jgi:hypothetical protein